MNNPIFYKNDEVTFEGETRPIKSNLFTVRCKYRGLAMENIYLSYQGKEYKSKKELEEALEKMNIGFDVRVTIGKGKEVLKLNDVKKLIFKSILDTVKFVFNGKEFDTYKEAELYVFALPLEYKNGWCRVGNVEVYDYQEQLSDVRGDWIKEINGLYYKGKNFKDREELKKHLMGQVLEWGVTLDGQKVDIDTSLIREAAAESIIKECNV